MMLNSVCGNGYPPPAYPPLLAWILGSSSGLIVILAIASLWYGLRPAKEPNSDNHWKQIILTVWVTLPPAWFALEFFFFYRSWGCPGSLETFKYGQDLAAKFWIAVSTALSALYLGPGLLRDVLSNKSQKPTSEKPI
jgi:hypothetical protein